MALLKKFTPTHWFLVAVALFCLARLGYELSVSPPAIRPNIITSDLRNFASVLAYHADPGAFTRDAFNGSGINPAVYRTYSLVYMVGLEGLHSLTGGDIELTYRLYSILAQALYLPAMFWLLRAAEVKPWLAGLVAFVSLRGSGFWATDTQWGITWQVIFPFQLSTALLLYVFLAIYYLWWQRGKAAAAWQVLGFGVVMGILTTRLNLINGFAAAQLIGGFSLLLCGVGRLQWRSLAWFMAGYGGAGILLYSLLAPDYRPTDMQHTFTSLEAVIANAQSHMVFPWGSTRTLWLGWSDARVFATLFLGGHFVFSVGLLRRPASQFAQSAWVLLQTAAMLVLMDAGWLPLLLLAYGGWRIWQQTWDETDWALWILLALALVLGPFQQLVAYTLWREGKIIALTSPLFEIARLEQFAYLPFYLLLARAIGSVLQPLAHPWLRGLLAGMAAYVVWLNLDQVPAPASERLSQGDIALVSLCLVGGWGYWLQLYTAPRRWLPWVAGLGLICLLTFERPAPYTSRYSITPEYEALTAWVRDHTPSESLFILTDLDGSFRYFARRSLVAARNEWITAMNVGLDPLTVKAWEDRILLGQRDAQGLVETARAAQADYLVVVQHAPPLNAPAALVYENALYQVYEVALLPDQTVLAQYPELYAAYQAQEPPIPAEAIIFNPATGTVAGRQTATLQIVEASTSAPPLDLLFILQHSRFEAEMPLSPAQLELLQHWRVSKAPTLLLQAGVDYLFFDSEWSGFLTEAEYALLNDRYTLLHEWQVAGRGYWLYQPVE